MKPASLTLIAIGVLTFTASAADGPKEALVAAAEALSDKSNYSWTSTVKVPTDAQFQPCPTEGKAKLK